MIYKFVLILSLLCHSSTVTEIGTATRDPISRLWPAFYRIIVPSSRAVCIHHKCHDASLPHCRFTDPSWIICDTYIRTKDGQYYDANSELRYFLTSEPQAELEQATQEFVTNSNDGKILLWVTSPALDQLPSRQWPFLEGSFLKMAAWSPAFSSRLSQRRRLGCSSPLHHQIKARPAICGTAELWTHLQHIEKAKISQGNKMTTYLNPRSKMSYACK
ncbi:uncharacterized protein BDR25DRAFT_363063 [Lindgomyces ingoldianus]|uniref:Uncharacterized protein n=1 Tax=Lindgomyces ingoldianus TaxID=673940 RepID=A0ACB6Q8F9_9PLEO|nr:uncharacterized protein BDR25DRAFT_363063 [Lindgomyces ingoldianus]KAF2463155.1 hypothetical protein BDR25DRAFT_363063 [Lindgomyces ingoldianus]